ncbi:hypothetical protein C8F04DRAFT_1258291 [Mycena alexandri]|uniref:Uncharacterized protein n=1 Tax=Mycena alexandri TaxID=1745969 RepID=A0AAD6X5Y7_9AGAR|nr:hypothetical protein C8F04DRAFT_1258291 [Mycena alexandri]
MVQISRALAFFALASTALALAVNSDATSVKGATVGDTDETAVHHTGIEEVNINDQDASVKSEASGTDVGSDVIAATTFDEDKVTVNATSAGVVGPAGTMALRPGSSVYIQNNNGYFLSRWGATGVIFGKTTPDVFCRFRADRLAGTNYVTLRADNGLTINVDHGANPPALWLNQLYPAGAFETVPAGDGKDFLVVRDVARPEKGPWAVRGENINGNAITTIAYPTTRFYALYIDEV